VRIVFLAVLLLAAGANAAHTQVKIDPIALPLSPASTALLVNEPVSDAWQARLTDALRAPRGDVRRVAARIVTVRHVADQVEAVKAALAQETEAAAVAELVRAMFAIGHAGDRVVTEAIDRTGGASTMVLAELMARQKGLAVLPFLPMIVEKGRDPVSLAGVLSVLAVRDSSSRRRIAQAIVATRSDELWAAYDTALMVHRVEQGPDEWLPALASDVAAIRRNVLWDLLRTLADDRTLPADVLGAALPAGDRPPEPIDTEALLRELVARATGLNRPGDLALAVVAAKQESDFKDVAFLWLTRAEREALERSRIATPAPTKAAPRLEAKLTGMPTRTAWPIIAGLTPELMRVTGCKASRESHYGAAEIEYGPDGTPKTVGLLNGSLGSGCDLAMRTLVRLTVARFDHDVSGRPREILLFPMQRDTVSCLDSFEPGTPTRRIAHDVTSPRVLHEAKPEYTRAAMERKAQGAVVADVIVSERGCSAYASVKRGLDPDLDLQALHAILRWKFAPALVDDKPVPVWVTIEVSFRLK
jgi:TonB family protein